jgi:hypothetical protein
MTEEEALSQWELVCDGPFGYGISQLRSLLGRSAHGRSVIGSGRCAQRSDSICIEGDGQCR